MRYFLIDKVTKLVPGQYVRGLKNVTLTEEILHDHFPDHPIMPGALILEAASQLAGLLLEATWNRPDQPLCRALLIQVDLAKFHEPAGPGDQLDILVRLESCRETAAQVVAEVTAGGKRIARAGLTFVMKAVPSQRVNDQRRYIYQLWTRDLNPPVTIL
jgi:3-hydroxyacyl-[acyl-carrier-protein] dehydratase